MDDEEPIDLNQLSGFEIKPDWADNLDDSKSGEKTRDYSEFDIEKSKRKGKGRDWNRDPGDRRGPRRDDARDDRRGGGRERRGGGWDRNRSGRGGNDRGHVRRVNPLKGKTVVELQPNPVFLKGISDTIKKTGHAYSLFELSKYFLSKAPQAIDVKFTAKEGGGVKFVYCPATGSVWLNREEAVDHLVENKAFEEYYEVKEVELGEPSGNFTVIGVCTMSNTIIGPPNHHDYQPRLRALHRRRFSRMPFERFQSRIEMRRDEETIKKWKEQESKQLHYVYRQGSPDNEPEVFKSLDDAKRHFLVHHGDEAFKTGNTVEVSQVLSKRVSQDLFNLVRGRVTFLERSPIEFVRILSRSLERSGLVFFKRDRKTIYVAAHRPRPLPSELILSERLGKITEHLRQNDGVKPVDLVTVVSGEAIPMPDGNPTPSPEQRETLKDLRWLVMEGYVVELSTGELHLIERKPGFDPSAHTRPKGKKKPRKRKPRSKNSSPGTGDGKTESKNPSAARTEPDATTTAREVQSPPERQAKQDSGVVSETHAESEETNDSTKSPPFIRKAPINLEASAKPELKTTPQKNAGKSGPNFQTEPSELSEATSVKTPDDSDPGQE